MGKRKCPRCKTFNPPGGFITGPGGLQAFCNIECMSKYAFQKKDKGYEIQRKTARKATAKRKQEIKTRREWIIEAQRPFNKFIRIRDTLDPCISCGISRADIESRHGWKVGGCWDAGHFKARGVKQQLRFNTYNCHKQCKSCNGGSGKFSHKAATVDQQYRINLIKKIGLARVEDLESNNELEKQDIEYLKRVKSIFNRRVKHLIKLRGY
jgi:hypothetical protein